jgi:hypothetical protein
MTHSPPASPNQETTSKEPKKIPQTQEVEASLAKDGGSPLSCRDGSPRLSSERAASLRAFEL